MTKPDELGGPGVPHAIQLATFAAGLRLEDLDGDVVAAVRRSVLDTVGLMAGSLDLPSSRAITAVAAAQGGAAEAWATGIPTRLPAAQAALVNGSLAHSLDFDDTHLPSIAHPSSSVVPAVLAAAERVGAGGPAVVPAVAVGIEVVIRLSMVGYDEATRDSVYFERGQHATSICGALGAAVAASMVLGADAERIGHALGIAASMAGGIIEANRAGGTVKRVHCGWAAHAGVMAADLAAAGLTGPPSALDGRFGFYRAFLSEAPAPEQAVADLGDRWLIRDLHVKPYPANHFTHGAIDAALDLRDRGLDPEAVERIEIRVPGNVIRTIGEPIERKRAPSTGYEAQFSAPYVVAAALLGGSGLGLGRGDFTDELASDPRRRALMAVTDVVADEAMDKRYPDSFPGAVVVTLRDGSEQRAEVWDNRGGPARPLTIEELATKFRGNAGALASADVDRIVRSVASLEAMATVGDLTAPLAALPG